MHGNFIQTKKVSKPCNKKRTSDLKKVLFVEQFVKGNPFSLQEITQFRKNEIALVSKFQRPVSL